jgi:hypothetical protein
VRGVGKRAAHPPPTMGTSLYRLLWKGHSLCTTLESSFFKLKKKKVNLKSVLGMLCESRRIYEICHSSQGSFPTLCPESLGLLAGIEGCTQYPVL